MLVPCLSALVRVISGKKDSPARARRWRGFLLAVPGAEFVAQVLDALAAEGVARLVQQHAVEQLGHALRGRQHRLPGVERRYRRRQGQEERDRRRFQRLDRRHLETAGLHDVGDAEDRPTPGMGRSEEHTSELQSLMRNSYAVFCLKKKTTPLHCPYCYTSI